MKFPSNRFGNTKAILNNANCSDDGPYYDDEYILYQDVKIGTLKTKIVDIYTHGGIKHLTSVRNRVSDDDKLLIDKAISYFKSQTNSK